MVITASAMAGVVSLVVFAIELVLNGPGVQAFVLLAVGIFFSGIAFTRYKGDS